MYTHKRVICISWNESLALTRQMLLGRIGCRVVSALGPVEALDACRATADLMVLGHSVPAEQKRALINCFRQHSKAPVLSILRFGEDKLPEATLGVDGDDPDNFLKTVQQILQ